MSDLAGVLDRHLIPVTESGCWLWTASTDTRGYGQLMRSGRLLRAHRTSWEIHRGEIPEGLMVLHKCDTRRCCNPDHLYLGTAVDNRRDMIERDRWRHPYGDRTTCAAGHNYEESGFYLDKRDGSRCCRACQREAKRKQRSKT